MGGRLAIALAACLLAAGCASHRLPPRERMFRMGEDSLTFANELVREYYFDPVTGEATHVNREPPSDYTHHCFVVAKSARQFFEHARFRPDLPKVGEREYRQLIRRVTGLDPARHVPVVDEVVIPGYRNLYEFSRDWEPLMKEVCGGAWRSYTQRGHWRMLFPFSRRHQEKETAALQRAIDRGHPPVVHLVKFPALTINHAILLIGYTHEAAKITFEAYDPNRPDRTTTLTYNRAQRTFHFPRNHYFVGGEVDVYEVYKSWNY